MVDSCLGINIKDRFINIAQVNKTGESSVVVSELAHVPIGDGLVVRGIIQDKQQIIRILKEIISSKEIKFTTKNAVFSFAETEGFVMSLGIQEYTTDEEIVEMGLEKFAGLIDNASFKTLVNRFSTPESNYAHLVAVRNSILEDLLEVGDKCGLNVLGLEIESQAKARGLVERMSTSGVVVLSLGDRRSILSIHDIYGLNFSTLIPVTGGMIDRRIAEKLGIDEQSAHKQKEEGGLLVEGENANVINEIFIKYLTRVVTEVKIATQNYERNFESKVKKIILEGELADLEGVFPFFNEKFDEYVVEKGKIWLSLKNEFDKDYIVSAAIGLALKGLNFQNSLNIFNFLEVAAEDNKGFLAKLFSKGKKSDYQVKSIERHSNIISEVQPLEKVDQDIPNEVGVEIKEDFDKNLSSAFKGKKLGQLLPTDDNIEDTKTSLNNRDTGLKQINDNKAVDTSQIKIPSGKKIGKLLPAEDEAIEPPVINDESSESNNVESDEPVKMEDEDNLIPLKAVTINDIRERLKINSSLADENKGLVQKKQDNKNITEVTQRKVTGEAGTVSIPPQERSNRGKKIKKRYLIILLIPIIFGFVFYISSIVVQPNQEAIKYAKSYSIDIENYEDAGFKIERIDGKFQIFKDELTSTGQVVMDLINEDLSRLKFSDLDYNLQEDYIAAEDLLDTNLIEVNLSNPSSIVYETSIIIVNKTSFYNFLSNDLQPELEKKGYRNYEIDKNESKIILKIDEKSAKINVEASGSLIQKK